MLNNPLALYFPLVSLITFLSELLLKLQFGIFTLKPLDLGFQHLVFFHDVVHVEILSFLATAIDLSPLQSLHLSYSIQ